MKKTKFLSVVLVITILIQIMSLSMLVKGETYYAQYIGSTEAGWGYKPDCTFTISKIVGNKFRGSFAAGNLGG